jgi:aspartyl-tRNA(Asn)/glutamyl-tRNA(Gln) amidotransferase subunit B
LSPYEANLLTGSKCLADYFEAGVNLGQGLPLAKRAKSASNWLLGEFTHWLNLAGIEIDQSKVAPDHLVDLLNLIDQGTLSVPLAKTVFEEMFHTGKPPGEIVAQKGLTQISEASAIEEIIQQVIAANTQAVADFHTGKQQALTFLVGQAMRATKGRANPKLVNEILRKELEKNS